MILLFTDFGLEGPYTGQVKAVLWREAPGVPVFDLFADAPMQRPQEAAYLLAAYAAGLPTGTVFLCVIDPGVGTDRPAEALHIDGRWFVGPGNGLFEPLIRRGRTTDAFVIPIATSASASFHGRDVFAPVAGRLAAGKTPHRAGITASAAVRRLDWPDDLPRIVYIDRYGNAMTGLRAERVADHAKLILGGRPIVHARTFGAVPEGSAFWYANSNGLVEVAVNRGRADALPGVALGAMIDVAGL